eukprot:6437717-Amphidinium_carterae.1
MSTHGCHGKSEGLVVRPRLQSRWRARAHGRQSCAPEGLLRWGIGFAPCLARRCCRGAPSQ